MEDEGQGTRLLEGSSWMKVEEKKRFYPLIRRWQEVRHCVLKE